MLKKLSIGLLTLALAAPALAEGDAAKGEKVFRKCKACHAVGDGAKNKVGPMLNGIVDAAAGANAGFKYSDALKAMAADGLVWDEASLTAYLTKPKDFMDGTKMSFPGLRKEADIDNVIAYLATFE
ncbi:cytochrome c family protein [uncultured Sulfitobacter sp.]|uniref:c-type cytochrome n=1 Tax=uncultured Sulfitobacter sp. TaxID=191468 RepID=UPI0026226D4C|nr:cytochrome c family protein [uncultured Sulfitobacter sp.]